MFETSFINADGYIEIKTSGIVSVANVMELGKNVITLSTQLEDQKKRVNIIVNSSEVESWGEGVFSLLVIILKDLSFQWGATFGANEEVALEQGEVIAISKTEKKTKVFKTRYEAQHWLAGECSVLES